jgi:asparagine synthase (glutamine-hydrolysing)
MCGIAGIFHYADPQRPVDPATLGAMTRSLAHRGPDGEGLWSAPGIGLGHRRLKVIDLSDQAAQPMHFSDGRLSLTFNGEIYNFRKLRAELEPLGHVFRTRSDSEVILAAYAQWGEQALERLSGIFAFALWNGARRQLLLARDPLGVKPLFYADDGATLRFGSEIKAILSDSGVARDVEPEALDAFLSFSYTPAPLTGFRAVRQLPPGHALRVDAGGVRARRYWDNPYEPQPRGLTLREAMEQFDATLERVTRAQLVSDVPVGAFLSGGLDSAAIVRAMRRGAGDVRALTVGFEDRAFDERAPARQTAAALGVTLDEQVVPLDPADLIDRVSRHLEEPTADSSAVPVYLLCQAARRRFTVAMSGDGADELLAGYDTYRATAFAARYRRLPRLVRQRVLAPAAACIPVRDGKYSLHQVAMRFVRGAELGPDLDHCAWRLAFSDELKRRLYTDDFAAAARGCDPLGRYAAHIRAVPPGRDRLCGWLNADTSFYLPNDMLVKVDRMSMAHGLEVRVPFLDVEMVRLCANLPSEFKLHRGRVRKHILRESLRGSVPDDVLRRRKSGFNVPLEQWMRGPLRERLLDVVSAQRDALRPWLRLAALDEVVREHQERRADHAHALFAVLMLALWMENAARCWK